MRVRDPEHAPAGAHGRADVRGLRGGARGASIARIGVTQPPIPTPLHPVSTWVWYVSAGADRQERNDRLAACPEGIRKAVHKRVYDLFEEAKKIRRPHG